jgi:hypothetical protein
VTGSRVARGAMMLCLGLLGACEGSALEPPTEADATLPDAVIQDSRPDAAAPPDAEIPELIDCDPMLEGTCPDDEKCSAVRTVNEARTEVLSLRFLCVSAVGRGEDGAACTRAVDVTPWDRDDDLFGDTCGHGLVCLDDAGSSTSRCRRVCNGMRFDCGEMAYCESFYDDPMFGYCAPVSACDPVYQRGCPSGQTCYPVVDTRGDLRAICRVYLPSGGSGGVRGALCELLNDCAPGLTCVLAGEESPGEARCERLCDVEESDRPATLGPGPGGCDELSDFCVPIALDDEAMSRLPVTPGLCQ